MGMPVLIHCDLEIMVRLPQSGGQLGFWDDGLDQNEAYGDFEPL